MNESRRSWISGLAACTLALAALAPSAVQAQYPERPLRMIVPSAPGDGSDVQIRIVAEQVGRQLGRTIVVENRPGAGMVVGAREAARAAPDGYTIFMGTNASNVIAPLLNPQVGYDPVGDFAPIARITRSPMLMMVPVSLGVTDLAGFLKLARERSDPFNFGSPGVGSLTHLSIEFLKARTGVPMIHVPYKGTAPALVDLMEGRIATMSVPLGNYAQIAASGKVRALMIADERRNPQFPEVPTAGEAGLEDFVWIAWSGIFAPAKTPLPILARLSAEFLKALEVPQVVESLARRGVQPAPEGQEQFAALIRKELTRYRSALSTVKLD
jgi:tripartite-type tricarboxylate transporter receptor subunit TctC